ncbi:hypothetical protein A3K63_00655 [Candidatus Micrarchaeota archaeon RBG_16_49_10]|nr:MAG: hypothetical protein A3K63_00655 [Candidatus Micrarchaeota archaeon RBG_16_49_10]
MKCFDLHVSPAFSEGRSSPEQIIERARLLGFSGICLVDGIKNYKPHREIKSSFDTKKFGIFIGFEATKASDLDRLVGKRREFDILIVKGGDLKINRRAVETPEVDILSIPEYERIDSGFNHIMAKLAKTNQVALEINFREALNSHKSTRSHIMQKMALNMMLAKKFRVPVITTSGAFSHLQLKDPYILSSFGVLLGLTPEESRAAISKTPEDIITVSKEKQAEEWIMLGVKVVK